MTTTIKITALTDIGANLAGTTLVPVVNMAGTPTTERANVNNIANFVLNKGTGANLGAVGNVTITGGTVGQLLSTNGNGTLSWTAANKTGVYTTSTLPSAVTAGAGARAFVTDATLSTFGSLYAGGAANAMPVWSNGTNWYIG